MHGNCGGVLSIKLPLARWLPLGKVSMFLAVLVVLLQPFSVLGAPDAAAINSNLFADSFESGNFDAWDSVGDGWKTVNANAQDGSRRADYLGTNTISEMKKTIDASSYENISLSYYYKRNGLKATDYGQVAYSVDGNEQILNTYYGETGTADNDADWQHGVFALPDADGKSDVVIIFRGFGSSTSNEFKLDMITVSGDEVVPQADENAPTIQLEAPIEMYNPNSISVFATDETELASVHIDITKQGATVDSCVNDAILATENVLTCSVLAGLDDGQYVAVFYAADSAGNMSEPGSQEFIVDHTMPSVTIAMPEDGFVTNFGAIHVNGEASDEVSEIDRVEYEVDEVTAIAGSVIAPLYDGVADGTNTWDFSALQFDTGFYRITVTAYDKANNNRSMTVDVEVDTSAPTTEIVSPVKDGELQSNDFQVVAKASDVGSGIQRVVSELYSGSQLLTFEKECMNTVVDSSEAMQLFNCNISPTELAGGNYTLRFYSVDRAGNQSESVFWQFGVIRGTVAIVPTIPVSQPKSTNKNEVVSRTATQTIIRPNNGILATTTAVSKAPGVTQPSDTSLVQTSSKKSNANVLGTRDESISKCDEMFGVCWQWLGAAAGVGAIAIGGGAYVLARSRRV